jgi:hypothetical protein
MPTTEDTPIKSEFESLIPVAAKPALKQVSFSTTEPADDSRKRGLGPGDHVRHPKYGVGQIVRIVGTGDDELVTIKFANDEKTTHSKYAKLELIPGTVGNNIRPIHLRGSKSSADDEEIPF